MLDRPEYIARYDKSDALGVIARMPEQLIHDYPPLPRLGSGEGLTSVVLAGMGGSAQPGEFIKTWLADRLPVPFVIVRDYALPAFVGPQTLVLVASYSGNTEETLAALEDARKRQARVVVVASGGALLAAAQEHKLHYIELPAAFQPRMAVLYAVRAMVSVLEQLGWVKGALEDLSETGEWLKGQMGSWSARTATADNEAKQIANELVGHVSVVYGGPVLAFAAMKWKIALNENAKNIAFYNYLPELNHNEFIGWGHPRQSGLKVIELMSDLDHVRVQKRFEVTNRLLSQAFAPIIVKALGDTKLKQLVWVIVLGEYVATYLAFLNEVDPMPVDLVERLKKELG